MQERQKEVVKYSKVSLMRIEDTFFVFLYIVEKTRKEYNKIKGAVIIKSNILKKIEELFLYFIMYSMIGWIYEVFLEVIVYKWGFTNRGVLFGPYCPVYGFGVLAFLFTIYPLIKNKPIKQKLLYIPVVFLGCMAIATLLELITSYICELFMGSWPWQTYARDYKIHFQGRIALSPSIRFGFGGTAFLYILQPLFEKLINKLGEKKVNVIAILFGIIMGLDCIYTFILKG